MPGKGNLPNYAEDRRERRVPSRRHPLHPHLPPPVLNLYPHIGRSVRHCPYAVPPGTLNETSPLQKWRAANRPQRRRYPSTSASEFLVDDPFRMLQELISDGSLIKEAVRRLQLGLSPKLSGNYYNDSDEDCRSSPGKKTLLLLSSHHWRNIDSRGIYRHRRLQACVVYLHISLRSFQRLNLFPFSFSALIFNSYL
ncbi:FRAT2 [Lepeophtheirus salmonis]|uniref:FRAT2 n=1 Tax=Lepeophtheirus salmonis TaxID=72036 RepID=A0A7R8D2I9_LEPSM|nr:FRAT2 [Lepeophtheirus salmonis]CAF3005238.1 FRAT2 [Lepeophtheirus salmonis]